ncbi:MAG: dephospho-CoA kinase [Bdellovibrionales bacterium]|nr:dephospho-CoA kinase [Bdellovibrionales bacterium]
MKRIGLTGGIGTGKSTVAGLFHELGSIPIIDADRIARTLRAPGGEAEAPLLKRFKTTDPGVLRDLLTHDPSAKRDLEAILHPLIQKKSELAFLEAPRLNPGAPFLLYEASLLIESGRAKDFAKVIVVTSPLEDRIARIMHRDGLSREAALQMINAQNPDAFRIPHADAVIDNSGSIEDLRLRVLKVLEQMKTS